MRKINKTQAALNLPTLTLEGGLFLPDQLEKAALGRSQWQSEADYTTPKGLQLKDDYSRAFQIACAQWRHFAAQIERVDVDATALTQTFVQELLRDVFGYSDIHATLGITIGERHYPISLLAGHVPVVVAPHTMTLHDSGTRFAIIGSGSRKKSAFMLAQEMLNASPDHLWALVCNGKQLRLLRDASTLTRPSFVEIDLADLLGGQRYAEFANVWRLLHASRAAGEPGTCIWERWRTIGQEEGTRVREGLRQGVTDALLTLGEGFLQHPVNDVLRNALHTGELSKDAYFQQLLRLIYRLIFLFSVEERGLLHPKDNSKSIQAGRRAYAEGYALTRLRDLCLKRRARNHFDDHWQALRIVFKGLDEGESRLALPALGGLFTSSQCPLLDAASLDNAHLLAAIQNLRWARHDGRLALVDYRNMGPEELGSVYESLLELVPEVDLPARRFGFVGLTSEGSTIGNARKLTGSYYTPDSLVQELIKSALEPVIAQRLAAQPQAPIASILSIRVIDPACGSGHFLLAAARRLAEALAPLRADQGNEQGESPEQGFRHALREVVANCIFGVDRNPMAVELARTALWLEGFEEGQPLGFLDHHLQVGDALLGLTDLKALEMGIAKDAFKPLSGDDKEACKLLAKTNSAALKDLEKKRIARAFGQLDVASTQGTGLLQLQALEALPEDTTKQIATKEAAYHAFLLKAKTSRLAQAADVLVGAYLLPKTAATQTRIPTSATLFLTLLGDTLPADQQGALIAATAVCAEARVLHWPLAFPQVFAVGGFDCVLGNPPWERIKLQEEEFFATRHRDVAEAKNKAERSQRIQWLSEGMLAQYLFPQIEHASQECAAEQRLYAEFITARRSAEAASVFAHVNGPAGGRYPLTGVGDVNTYALFAETISQITHVQGRAGFIVPTGIATDDSTKAYFGMLATGGRLVSLYDFENREKIFAAVDSRMKFCLITLGTATESEFAFFLTQAVQLGDERRHFSLSAEDFTRINPNTLTCPVFRTRRDAELTRQIYQRVPVLIREARGNTAEHNPWGISFMAMFHMSNDSYLFHDSDGADRLPLYEAKMIHQFDHRWATYIVRNDEERAVDVSLVNKQDSSYSVTPRYWVDEIEVRQRMKDKGWARPWLLGFRDICRATDERTVIVSVMPVAGVGNKAPLILCRSDISPGHIAALQANLSALVFDFAARQKVGGTTLNFFLLKQFAVLPPDYYGELDLAFIMPRVLELTYTAHDMRPWALDLGYAGEPFAFDPSRRAQLRAELDAWYARAYGLSRDELRYILDPVDVMGEGYPSETFRVLKNNELKEFDEYRTGILVLREFDRMAIAEVHAEPYVSLLEPQPGRQGQATYSVHGFLKDETDARLLGLLFTMVQQRDRLSRRYLSDALALGNQTSLLSAFADAEGIDIINGFKQRYPSIFDAARLAGDHIYARLRHLESVGLIRLDLQTDKFVAVPGVALPSYVLKDNETVNVAAVLTQAAEQVSIVGEMPSTDISVKRA